MNIDRQAGGCPLGPLGPLDSPAETKRGESEEIEKVVRGDGGKERQDTLRKPGRQAGKRMPTRPQAGGCPLGPLGPLDPPTETKGGESEGRRSEGRHVREGTEGGRGNEGKREGGRAW